MNIYAAVFVYKRPKVLRSCLKSVFSNTLQPDAIELIQNGPDEETSRVMDEEAAGRAHVFRFNKADNMGATHSFACSYEQACRIMPKYFFPIEADYIFRPWAFETIVDIFENTQEGQLALGIVGYDHPNFYVPQVRDIILPRCMIAQMGEDNVNRAALHQPFYSGRYVLELVSNTCPTSYLHWQRIMEVAKEFPELWDLLEQVGNPRDNPNYPDSRKYRLTRQTDDGMLSHAISLVWNRWAIKHGIDRNRFGAWLNVKPSLANNITGGGVNAKDGIKEMETDGGSPSWTT